jgi:hypothetical protein
MATVWPQPPEREPGQVELHVELRVAGGRNQKSPGCPNDCLHLLQPHERGPGQVELHVELRVAGPGRKTTRSSPLNSPTIHFSTAAVVPLAQGGRGNHSPPTVSSTPSACLTASTATTLEASTATHVALQLLGSQLQRPLLLGGLHCDPVSLELLGSKLQSAAARRPPLRPPVALQPLEANSSAQ